jgi:hypothetical protein
MWSGSRLRANFGFLVGRLGVERLRVGRLGADLGTGEVGMEVEEIYSGEAGSLGEFCELVVDVDVGDNQGDV